MTAFVILSLPKDLNTLSLQISHFVRNDSSCHPELAEGSILAAGTDFSLRSK
jgi:hypothetical protein